MLYNASVDTQACWSDAILNLRNGSNCSREDKKIPAQTKQ